MTMNREDKQFHQVMLSDGLKGGYTREKFASPDAQDAAIKDRGHVNMTAKEYAEHRMNRRTATRDSRGDWAKERHGRRKITRK